MMKAFILIPVAAALISGACKPTPPAGASAGPASVPAQQAPQASTPAAAPAAAPAANGGFAGRIAETMDSGGYTYARLQGGGKDDVWIAAPQFDAKVGEQVTVSLDMPMPDFQSKTLNRTFPMLYFVQEVARNGQALSAPARPAAPPMMSNHGDAATAAPVEKIAPPAGGLSIADVFAKKTALSGKPVTVRGTVVKFNGGIMDRNWLHLQDGSGSADAHDNDLTVTTDAAAKVGDVVTASGVLGTGKDFGAGYAYDAILEKATLTGK
jgi:hypothetical protein